MTQNHVGSIYNRISSALNPIYRSCILSHEVLRDNDVDAAKLVDNEGLQAIHKFEKIITASQAHANQTLPLPRDFVKNFLKEEWDSLVIRVDDRWNYSCKLVWSSRSILKDECHLGKGWCTFVKEMGLRSGDKVLFRTIDNNVIRVKWLLSHTLTLHLMVAMSMLMGGYACVGVFPQLGLPGLPGTMAVNFMSARLV
ncbi:DNA-binding barrel domain superfamily [Sesbania bispinosa]|nr:DNA-binding barrel domain superfamily [Sesbania bispinosa]